MIDQKRLARALVKVGFDLDLWPASLTAHPGWYDEPGPDDHLVFDSEQWGEDVAAAVTAAYEADEGA